MDAQLTIQRPFDANPEELVLAVTAEISGFAGPWLLVPAEAAAAWTVGTCLGLEQGRPLFRVAARGLWPQQSAGEVAASLGRCCLWLAPMEGHHCDEGPLPVRAWKPGYSLAWVTLSDKGSRGERPDESGPLVEALVRERLPVCLARGHILPDERSEIEALLTTLARIEGFDLILTTGGTGVAPRDVTPEATLRVIDKRLPGFEQAMMQTALAKTPYAALSRAVAGTAGTSLVVNLPGSPKAVRENLSAILPAFEHTLRKLQGDPADCATLEPAGGRP